MKLIVNGESYELDVEPDMPLLWVLRDELNIKGPKFGCGMALCGACTVHVDGNPVRACSYPVSAVSGEVTTIEGLGTANNLSVIQQVWIEKQVAQCGYCQAGQIMSAAALLANNSDPDDAAIDAAMTGNLCRCATYPRVRGAIKAAAKRIGESATPAEGQADLARVDTINTNSALFYDATEPGGDIKATRSVNGVLHHG